VTRKSSLLTKVQLSDAIDRPNKYSVTVTVTVTVTEAPPLISTGNLFTWLVGGQVAFFNKVQKIQKRPENVSRFATQIAGKRAIFHFASNLARSRTQSNTNLTRMEFKFSGC
jgi:hypothetical protein